jgi:hypothetical protein
MWFVQSYLLTYNSRLGARGHFKPYSYVTDLQMRLDSELQAILTGTWFVLTVLLFADQVIVLPFKRLELAELGVLSDWLHYYFENCFSQLNFLEVAKCWDLIFGQVVLAEGCWRCNLHFRANRYLRWVFVACVYEIVTLEYLRGPSKNVLVCCDSDIRTAQGFVLVFRLACLDLLPLKHLHLSIQP